MQPTFAGLPLSALTFVAFDTETTGLWAPSHRLVELAGAKFRLADSSVSHCQSLINPMGPIPSDVIAVHGITDQMVADAPSADLVLDRFFAFCGEETVLVAHNAPFDIAFIAAELDRAGRPLPDNPILDTVDLTRHFLPGLASYSLESLVQALQLATSQEHRALADAELVRLLFVHLSQFWPPGTTLSQLVHECGQYHFADGRLREPELPEQYTDLLLACREQCALEIIYASPGRPPEPRRIRPLRLFEQRSTIYIRAFCEKSRAERTFRLDRLQTFRLVRP